jgi:type I restriction enzyme S subunit
MSEALEQSDLREGYKEVEFGPKTLIVPSDWNTERFGDVFHRRRESIDEIEDETVKYVGLKHLDSGQLDINGYDEDGRERSSSRVFRKGDILFGKLRPNLNKAAIAPFSGVCSSDIIPIYAEKEGLQRYLPYLMHSKLVRDRVVSTMEGTNLPRTSWGDLEKTLIPLPPSEEQLHIADILSKVDEQLQQTNDIISETEYLKRGVLNKLIPRGINKRGKIRPSPEDKPDLYEEVRRCKIPSGWEVSSLQELCKEDVTYGIVQAGPHVDDGVPYIKTGDMTDGKLKLEGLSRTSTEIAEDYDRSKIRTGELVIAIRATVGVVHQVPPDLDGGNLTQGTTRISPKDSIDNRYLLWAVRSNIVQSLIEARTKGSTFNEITLGTLRKVPIPHPVSLDEQKKIAERLDAVSEKLDKEMSHLKGLQELKRGLMQDLLTGKVRVNTDD